MIMGERLLFFVTEDWYFCSHRLQLAVAAKSAGYDVAVLTRERDHGGVIRRAGIRLIPLEISRSGRNPFGELRTLIRILRAYRREKPDIVHHVALKPVLYGSLAALLVRVPYVINAFAGLGLLFSSSDWRARLARPWARGMFRLLLNNGRTRVILQNPDDVAVLSGLIRADRIRLIRGSGVDVDRFEAVPEPRGETTIILASRLLWDKGIGEYVRAAKTLRKAGTTARFVVVGRGDEENPRSIADDQMRAWHEEGVIEWWGYRDDMPEVFAACHIVCLPSYYGEGVPKVLLEAAACGRPIVTTDFQGCREVVHHGDNGLLVPPRDVAALSAALDKLIAAPALRDAMGAAGRKLVVDEFSLDQVVGETLALYSGD